MKKLFLFMTLLLFASITRAQNNADSATHFYYRLSPTKATVHYKGDRTYTGMLAEISDSSVTLFALQTGDSAASQIIIPIAVIQKVRVKRHAVELGFIYGAGSGFIAGGLAGVVIDAESGTSSDDETDGAFIVGGIIGAIPGGLIGAGIGGVVTRGGFKINGNKEKAKKLGKILDRRQKTLKGSP